MNELREIAEKIVKSIELKAQYGGISVNEMPDIIDKSSVLKEPYNLYPGTNGFNCYDLAIFISLTSQHHKSGHGHFDIRRTLEKIVQHMQGSCKNKTLTALVLTDNWDANAFQEWKANVKQIQSFSTLEIYLMTDGQISPVL